MCTIHDLVVQYVPLANKLAFQKKKNLPKFVDVEDLKSAAYLGLVEAANRFDPSIGVAFSTYAYPRIFGAIQDYLRDQGWLRRGDLTPVLSLDTLSEVNGGCALKDLVEAKSEGRTEETLEVVTLNLDEQAKTIIRSYFFEDHSMKEVGDKLGVSESRVSQLIKLYKDRIKTQWTQSTLIAELAA